MLLKIEGIVLRQTKFKESDKILTIFSRENGKIQAIAKGARKPKNKLIASTQIFSDSNFIVYKGKNLYNINQGDIISSFYPLREDLKKLAYATYIMELVDSTTFLEEPNNKLFQLLLKTLKILTLSEDNINKLIRAFELKYMSFIGYRPHLKDCVSCGNELSSKIKFSINYGGVLCKECLYKDTYARDINIPTLEAIEYLLYSKLDRLDEKDIDNNILLLIEDILFKYILGHTDKKSFKSLKFLQEVK